MAGLAACLAGTAACRRSASSAHAPSAQDAGFEVVLATGTIGIGGTISKALDEAGVSPAEGFKIQQALKPHQSLRAARPQHRYEIHRSTIGTVVRMNYFTNPFEYYQIERAGSAFHVRAMTVPFTQETLGVQGTIENSLWESMTGAGIPPDVIWRFSDIFGWRVDFLTEPRKGDRFRLIWTRDLYGSNTRDGEILAASYANAGRPEFVAFLIGNDYFDREGQSLRGEFLRAPLAYRRISSGFTSRRFHPILRYNRPHHGTDYAAPSGTPVQSIGDGRVISAGYDRGLGYVVRVRHSGSYVSIYGHLKGFAKGIRSGVTVKQGQTVGYVGSTGLSTGPHLHFAFEVGGRLVNFLNYKFKSKARIVPAAQQAEFTRIKKERFEALSRLSGPSIQKIELN